MTKFFQVLFVAAAADVFATKATAIKGAFIVAAALFATAAFMPRPKFHQAVGIVLLSAMVALGNYTTPAVTAATAMIVVALAFALFFEEIADLLQGTAVRQPAA